MLSTNEILLFKKHLTFWDKLTDKQKDKIIKNTSVVRYQKDSSIHTADLDCVGLLLPKTGTLRVYILSEEGREVTLYRIRSGSVCILSAACVLHSITFDVSIDAVTDCELLQLDSAVFLSIMQENIYVEAFAYRKATERFSDAMWAMQQILFMSFDKRLALFLLDETSKTGSQSLRMTHEEIAKYMGSAREVVSRMLKYFSSEGLVRISRGEILITDHKKLMTLV